MSEALKQPNSDNLVDIGEEHHRAGRLQEAEAHYRQALEIDPDHPGALYFLANIAYEDGRLSFATQLAEALLRSEPNDAEAWHLLGRAAFRERNLARSSECFKKALELQPGYALAYLSLGDVFHAQEDLNAALANFQRAATINPAFAEAYCSIGNIFKKQNRFEEAISSYRQAIDLKSNFEFAHEAIGRILLSQGKSGEAITMLRKAAVEIATSPLIHATLGAALLSENKNMDAAASFERALELKPDYAEAYHNRGRALQNLNRFDEALLDYDKALVCMPYYPEAYYNRGNTLLSLMRLDEALISYDKAIALKSDYAEALQSRDNVLQNFKKKNKESSEFVEANLKNAHCAETADAATKQIPSPQRSTQALKPSRLYRCPIPPGFESHYADYRYPPNRFADNKFIVDGREVRIRDRLGEPEVIVFENILSDVECELLISLSRPTLQRSSFYDTTKQAGELVVSTDRTSEGTFFMRSGNAFFHAIEMRLARLMNMPYENGEGLQVLHYTKGAEYRPHYDFYAPELASSAVNLQASGQRVATLILYLNDVESGGETVFPEIDFAVTPRKGCGVYFSYCDEAGKLDRLTLHAGAPVKSGEKWIATKWVRQRRHY